MRLRSVFGGLVVATACLGCASPWYYPDQDGFPDVSPEEAWGIISSLSRGRYAVYQDKGQRVERVELVWNGLRYTLEGGPPHLCKFEQLKPAVLSSWQYVDRIFVCDLTIADDSISRKYAGALYVLQRDYQARQQPEGPEQIAAFERVVKDYRSKPAVELPEAVKRYLVQAEFAIQEKRFDDAASLYGKALGVAPWWPQGRHNRGLLLGELGAYTEAVRELKKYLQLEPAAPNAAEVQVKIYQWESVSRR